MKSPKSAIFNQKLNMSSKYREKLKQILQKLKQILKKTQDFEPKTTCNGGSMPQYPSTLCRKKKACGICIHILADRVVQSLMQKMAAEVAYWQS